MNLQEKAEKEAIKDAVYLVTGNHILDYEAEGILHLYKKHSKDSGFIPILIYVELLYLPAKR